MIFTPIANVLAGIGVVFGGIAFGIAIWLTFWGIDEESRIIGIQLLAPMGTVFGVSLVVGVLVGIAKGVHRSPRSGE
ncbi:hypothetical protein [Ruegeria atlantica]|uniref:Uncharacterized protein n=1 Tax=Ruegeria atlantica TaxID=81569 RepID=A0A0P1EHX7_9RHOB|nr:hypothetical protein [Ruegeria atlantica]CUH49653.1 hypothetical protein RUA4292_03850 [Ruegeria atlantica]